MIKRQTNLTSKRAQRGFSLIEIVLVLAVASLLLIIVFIAVQGAQRSRRDGQRQQDAGRALAALEQCSSRNAGSYTTPIDCAARLVPDNYLDPANQVGSASDYVVITSGTPGLGEFLIPGSCGGTISVAVGQEAGAVYCVHN